MLKLSQLLPGKPKPDGGEFAPGIGTLTGSARPYGW